jgi:hypothetical protein
MKKSKEINIVKIKKRKRRKRKRKKESKCSKIQSLPLKRWLSLNMATTFREEMNLSKTTTLSRKE